MNKTLILALCASMAFGSSVALQERAAAEVHTDHAMRVGLLMRVARRPMWLLGLVASVLGLILQIGALRHGSLVLVQPVMATTLIFALALVAIRTRVALSAVEWASVIAVVGGLVVFLIFAAPNGHTAEAPHGTAWAITSGGAVVIVGALAWLSTRRHGRRRAALMGLAVGLSNAFVAVLTKAFSRQLRHGGPLWDHWALWALIAAGIPAMLLVQSLYQSGNLRMSLPIVAVVEPVAASLAGVRLFGENIRLDGDETVVIAIGVVAAVVGLWHLAGNPRIAVIGATPRVSVSRASSADVAPAAESEAITPGRNVVSQPPHHIPVAAPIQPTLVPPSVPITRRRDGPRREVAHPALPIRRTGEPVRFIETLRRGSSASRQERR
jgi:drug/metabolite transporter (DMT)-like permease